MENKRRYTQMRYKAKYNEVTTMAEDKLKIQMYELTCTKCGEKFFSKNPRVKICDECKAKKLHDRLHAYYENTLKQKRAEQREKRIKKYKVKVCRTCGAEFRPTSKQHVNCPSCIEKAKTVIRDVSSGNKVREAVSTSTIVEEVK